MSLKLYEIPSEWARLQDELVEACGELTPEFESRMAALATASKDKLTAAGLVKRNLELHAEMADAQARVFQDEAARVTLIAKSFEAAADRLGALMAPGLRTVGNIKTVAGTLYAQRRVNYSIALKPGVDIKSLPRQFWRQAEPELNKKPLQDLAKQHPLTDAQLEFVIAAGLKAKDRQRIESAKSVTDADLEALTKPDLPKEAAEMLAAIAATRATPPQVVAVPYESLTTCLKTPPAPASAAEPAPAAEAATVAQPAPAQPAPEPFTDPMDMP